MKSKKILGAVIASCLSFGLFANDAEEQLDDVDLNQVSRSFGHLIRKNIESMGLEFDVNLVIKGIEESLAGQEAPMDENQTVQAISLIQENSFKKQSSINLQLAEEFLANNRMKDEVFSLEDGKVQYAIDHQGSGSSVEAESSPTVRFSGEFADGTVFASSTEDEVISLSETIPGLAKALVGMKEGEQRTAFIHPEFAYGESGYLPPNSLLTFHIEVIKADTPLQEEVENQTFEELAGQPGEEVLR